MSLLIAIHRVGRAARCALCHDDLDAAPRACSRCAASLHADCWELAGECPTLGCARPVRRVIAIAPRYLGANWFHFGTAMTLFALVQLGAWVVVPTFQAMWEDVGLYLSPTSEALLWLAQIIRSPLSLIVGVAAAAAFARAPQRPIVRNGLVTLAGWSSVVILFGILALLRAWMIDSVGCQRL